MTELKTDADRHFDGDTPDHHEQAARELAESLKACAHGHAGITERIGYPLATSISIECNELDRSHPGAVFWVECDGCGAQGPNSDTEAEAIAAWNTRAPDAETVALVAAAAELVENSIERLMRGPSKLNRDQAESTWEGSALTQALTSWRAAHGTEGK